jgi:hypothetical protein
MFPAMSLSLSLFIFHWYIHDSTSVKQIGEGLNVRKSKNKKRVVNKRKNGLQGLITRHGMPKVWKELIMRVDNVC